MEKIVVVNGNEISERQIREIVKTEKLRVLMCFRWHEYGIMFELNGNIDPMFKLSKVVLVEHNKNGIGGCQYALHHQNIPEKRRYGYVS